MPILKAMVATVWFLAASLSGIACALLALAVITAGWTRRVPEVAFLGSGLFALSVFATAFGLSITSFGGGEPASPLPAFLALPAAVAATFPLLNPSTRLARLAANRWRLWVIASGTLTILGAAITMQMTSAPDDATKGILLGTGVLGSLGLVRRQIFLYRISGKVTALTTAAAVGSLTLSTSLSHLAMPGSAASWTMLVMENLAVFSAGGAIIVGYRTGHGVAEVLRPVLSAEPLAALEVGLSPEVHSFVAALECRDRITRDHVVRTSALAMRIAVRAGLSPREVREVALGALLHDIGKLVIPSEIIKKPGGLTDEEFATIKTHPEQGERLLENAPALAGAARFVRGHHERVDGRGYPDGLAGDEVTLAVGIVSVSDAWDAMTHTRQYRTGMGTEKATEILRKGAGAQWRGDAVLMLLAEVEANGHSDLEAAGPIGRHHLLNQTTISGDAYTDTPCCCEDAVPTELLDSTTSDSPQPSNQSSESSERTRSIARPRVANRSSKVSPAG